MNSSSFKSEPLSEKIVDAALNKVFGNYTSMNTGFIVYVGKLGQIALDIDMQRAFCNFPETYMESVRKGKYSAIVHLVNKSGLLKAYYNYKNDNFEVKKGTKLLFISNSIGACTFEKLGFEVTFKTSNKKISYKRIKRK